MVYDYASHRSRDFCNYELGFVVVLGFVSNCVDNPDNFLFEREATEKVGFS